MRYVIFTLLAATACAQSSDSPNESTPEGERVCTLIGCESGLDVRVEGIGNESFTVRAEGDGRTESATCRRDQGCSGTVFLRDFTAATATISVSHGTGTFTHTVRPDYGTLQPNGPDCPPTCTRAQVIVSPTSGDAGEGAPSRPADRPATITDTLRIEGMAEPVRLSLVRSPASFPLPFSTYVPADLRGEFASSGEGDAYRIVWREGNRVNRGARIQLTVLPAGTSRSEAARAARTVAETGGGEVSVLADPDPWAIEAFRYRRPGDAQRRIVGWVQLGERDGRYYHWSAQYPAEMGDGMGPRIAAVLKHLRWE